MDYEISDKAQQDLEKIWLYTFENWSLEQADYYYDLLLDEMHYLAQNPKSGKDYSAIRKGYYRSKVKSHFIFYRINSAKQVVEIIRILHQQMDIEARFEINVMWKRNIVCFSM